MPQLLSPPFCARVYSGILECCQRLVSLNGAEISKKDRLTAQLNPIVTPPKADEDEAEASSDTDLVRPDRGTMPPMFVYRGLPKAVNLEAQSQLIATALEMPAPQAVEAIERVEASLSALFMAPPEVRISRGFDEAPRDLYMTPRDATPTGAVLL